MQKEDTELGPGLLDELSDDSWKVVPKISTDSVEEIPEKTSKKSRKNKDKGTDSPKKNKEEVKVKKVREFVDPFDFILLSSTDDRILIEPFLPSRFSFRSAYEEKSFYSKVNAYFRDFEFSELSSSDIDNIITLAMNKIMEERLARYAVRTDGQENSSSEDSLLETTASIERFRKDSAKIRSDLASTRSARIDPKAKQNFSIIDIVVAFDERKRKEFEKRVKEAEEEMEKFLVEKR